jgi:hypothetical protein
MKFLQVEPKVTFVKWTPLPYLTIGQPAQRREDAQVELLL